MVTFRGTFAIILPILATSITSIDAFQTSSKILPMRIDPIPKDEISQRLGLKQNTADSTASTTTAGSVLSIGSGPNMAYTLSNEHEVVCPVSGAHQGVLCKAALLSTPVQSSNNHSDDDGDSGDAESISNNRELVSQAILSGSLAASIRSRCKDGNSVYYLPIVVTLVESLMADEMINFDFYARGENVFNSNGLETNEILMDWSDDNSSDFSTTENDNINGNGNASVMLYACNTHCDHNSATSDIYVLPQRHFNNKGEENKVWRFSVDYKVVTINLQSINSFGDRDSTTPLRPDVWLKDDYY